MVSIIIFLEQKMTRLWINAYAKESKVCEKSNKSGVSHGGIVLPKNHVRLVYK